MEFSRKRLENIHNEVVKNITRLSEYTPEEAKQIYETFPYYMMLLDKLNKGATIEDVTWFILEELKLNK
jgi:hypothetical protein